MCDAKISAWICSEFILGWVQGNIFMLFKCPDQCSKSIAMRSISKWESYSKGEYATIPGKNWEETDLPKAILCYTEVS